MFFYFINLVIKATSRNIKCLSVKVSNINVINVPIKLVKKVTSRDIKCQFMTVSNINAISVTIKLVNKVTLRHKISVDAGIKYQCNQC